MSKKDEISNQPEELALSLNPFVLPIDRTKEPVELASILQAMGLNGPRIPAEELVGQGFTILGAKAFQSSFKQDAHAYFCVCALEGTGEIITTVLGGQAVVDIIDALTAQHFDSPLKVRLNFKQGGAYGGYYFFE